jgi:hypothetical protein
VTIESLGDHAFLREAVSPALIEAMDRKYNHRIAIDEIHDLGLANPVLSRNLPALPGVGNTAAGESDG